jgi:hypothetical protein
MADILGISTRHFRRIMQKRFNLNIVLNKDLNENANGSANDGDNFVDDNNEQHQSRNYWSG